MRLRLMFTALFALVAAAGATAEVRAPAAGTNTALADWAVLVVAADEHANGGKLTEGFDNARRELSQAFLARGVQPENLRQLSVDPARDPATKPLRATPAALDGALGEVAARARGGCLLYFTSHGNPSGIVLGEQMYSPRQMAGLADAHCAGRPTVIVVSACYSGVFVPALEKPERLILTAARPDRSSFGCGESDRMPYFDACVLASLPDSLDFLALGRAARLCVDREERAKNLRPASEPQMSVGAEMRAFAPLLRLDGT